MLRTHTNLLTGEEHPVQNLMVCGEKKTTLQIGGGGDDAIVRESALTRQTADPSLQAQPLADKIQEQIEAGDKSKSLV